MEKFIILRHGSANLFTRELTEQGADEINDLVAAIESDVIGRVEIWCSTEKRAKESASIIGRMFSCIPKLLPLLVSSEDIEPQSKELLSLIDCQTERFDTLIAVTHAEYLRELPNKFRERFMQLPPGDMDVAIEPGQGWLFSLRHRGVRRIP